jgi:ABC-2 type transport system permease protein
VTATTRAPSRVLDRPGLQWRQLADFYRASIRMSIVTQFQYRTNNYAYMIGMVFEPVIYLVVWSTVARSQGGSVGGLAPGDFAAYYITWTLVRNMNIAFTPYGWEERIRTGELSGLLMRPIHPLHYDLAFFAGWKVVVIVLWLPIAALLTLLFHPTLHVSALGVAVFAVAIWAAYVIRSLFLFLLGMVTFATTRVGAIYDLYFTAELLLSGRLVPLVLMPSWAIGLGALTPFPSTFGFPIEALTGRLGATDLLRGLGIQVAWVLLAWAAVAVIWPLAVKRYSAVGN